MKARVLLICYYFPPLGLAGVRRPLNLFKHLPTFGYETHVLTVKSVAYRAHEPELLEGLDRSKIFRAGSFDPQRIMYLLGIRRVNPRTIARGSKAGEHLFPDSKVGWVRKAVKLGLDLHERFNYSAIISTSPPISSHLVGMRLAAMTGVRWIADLRDPWTIRPAEQVYSRPSHIDKARRLRKDIVAAASAITAVRPSIIDYWTAGQVITNGYDPESAQHWTPPEPHDELAIGLLGTFNDDLPVRPLFRGLAQAIKADPALTSKFRIVQVGQVNKGWLHAQIEREGVRVPVVMHGVQSPLETIRLLRECALMYYGVSDQLADVVGARWFDLLASGRPILVHAPRGGELASMASGIRACFRFVSSETAGASSFIRQVAEEYFAGKLPIMPEPEYARKYAWPNIVRQFAELMDTLT